MAEIDDSIDGDESFSMEDLEKDLKKGRGGRRGLWFLIGLIFGVGGAVAAPRVLAPYLPDALRGRQEILSGPVLAEERTGDRLLLTIETEPGALIASFTRQVDEIALLVDPGDIVTIAVREYEPFVDNPDFKGVRKRSSVEGDSDAKAGSRPQDGPGAAEDSAVEEDPAVEDVSAIQDSAKEEPSAAEAATPDTTASPDPARR